jgi:enoyl-CoA hydratase/carnithine racemase
MAEQRVSITMESNGVAQVRLTRADKLNALDPAMFDAIEDAGHQLRTDKSLRAVVLSGEGRAFSAGLDFPSFTSLPADDPNGDLLASRDYMPANRAQSAAYVWISLPVPVIAAVHGYAFGGGLQIALGADIRFVSPDAELSVMEMKWGLIPDMTGTQTLRHLVPMDVAKELTFTARRVAGEEAVRIGLATHCVDNPLEAATQLADEIAGKSPQAVRAAKRLIARAYTAEPVEGLQLEEGIQRTLLGSKNQTEAVMANMEKRTPDFEDID